MNGYIYCLTNSTIPGLVKIGKTSRQPELRAAEISGSTGVPKPFKIEWSRKVRNMDKAEADLHAVLSEKRLSKRREFFRCTPKQAFNATKSLQSFTGAKNVRPNSPVLQNKRRRRYDRGLGFALSAVTVGTFGAAILFDLAPSTIATTIATTGLALSVIFQGANLRPKV